MTFAITQFCELRCRLLLVLLCLNSSAVASEQEVLLPDSGGNHRHGDLGKS